MQDHAKLAEAERMHKAVHKMLLKCCLSHDTICLLQLLTTIGSREQMHHLVQ